MHHARHRGLKFRPVPLKFHDKLQEVDSFCISCGSRNVVVFRPNIGNTSKRLIKCQSCGVISPDFGQSKVRPSVKEDFVPLDKERAQRKGRDFMKMSLSLTEFELGGSSIEMADQILDAFTHQRTQQKLQRALAFAQGDLGLICHKYLPIAIEVFAYVVSSFGFTESTEGVIESVRVMQTHAKDDEQLVQKIINIRKLLTPTASWIKEDNDAEKDDERRRDLEQQALLQRKEEEHRKELLAQEIAKKARLRAKKIALGIDPSVERPPVLVDVPPPLVVAIENAYLELRVNAKYVQKFQWFFNGHPIDAEEFVFGTNRCTLVIKNLTKRVTGEYICTCENEEGTVRTPTCRVSLAALKLSRVGSKPLGTLPSSPMFSFEKNMMMTCAGGKIKLCDAKSLDMVQAFPALPATMGALAWDPETKMLAAFSKSIQQEKSNESVQVFFYSPERPGAGSNSGISPTLANHRRNKSNVGVPAKPKLPPVSNSLKFQLVDVQSVDVMNEVHAAAFLENRKKLLVTDMTQQIALYDLSSSFTCRKIISFGNDVVCHVSVSPKTPIHFAVAFRNKSFIKLYTTIDNNIGSTKPTEHCINFNFPVHRAAFDSAGFSMAVAETGFMKSWISIVNVNTKKPSKKRFVVHAGRISGLQWTSCSSLLITSSHDGYVKVWDPVAMSNLLSVHLDMHGIHSMVLMEELAVLVVVGYSDCCLQSRTMLQLPELEASRLVEMNKQAANIQKIWKGRKTRELIAKYIRGAED